MVIKENCMLCNNPNIEDILDTNQLCEECLNDIYRCEQCGFVQACCSECVL